MIEPPFQVDHQTKTIHSIEHERLGWVSCLPTSRPTEDETDAVYILWLHSNGNGKGKVVDEE